MKENMEMTMQSIVAVILGCILPSGLRHHLIRCDLVPSLVVFLHDLSVMAFKGRIGLDIF